MSDNSAGVLPQGGNGVTPKENDGSPSAVAAAAHPGQQQSASNAVASNLPPGGLLAGGHAPPPPPAGVPAGGVVPLSSSAEGGTPPPPASPLAPVQGGGGAGGGHRAPPPSSGGGATALVQGGAGGSPTSTGERGRVSKPINAEPGFYKVDRCRRLFGVEQHCPFTPCRAAHEGELRQRRQKGKKLNGCEFAPPCPLWLSTNGKCPHGFLCDGNHGGGKFNGVDVEGENSMSYSHQWIPSKDDENVWSMPERLDRPAGPPVLTGPPVHTGPKPAAVVATAAASTVAAKPASSAAPGATPKVNWASRAAGSSAATSSNSSSSSSGAVTAASFSSSSSASAAAAPTSPPSLLPGAIALEVVGSQATPSPAGLPQSPGYSLSGGSYMPQTLGNSAGSPFQVLGGSPFQVLGGSPFPMHGGALPSSYQAYGSSMLSLPPPPTGSTVGAPSSQMFSSALPFPNPAYGSGMASPPPSTASLSSPYQGGGGSMSSSVSEAAKLEQQLASLQAETAAQQARANQARADQARADQARVTHLKEEIAAQQRKLAALSATSSSSGVERRPFPRSPESDGDHVDPRVRCFACNGFGHKSNVCTSSTGARGGGGGDRTPRVGGGGAPRVGGGGAPRVGDRTLHSGGGGPRSGGAGDGGSDGGRSGGGARSVAPSSVAPSSSALSIYSVAGAGPCMIIQGVLTRVSGGDGSSELLPTDVWTAGTDRFVQIKGYPAVFPFPT